jgi:hypothetical protein
MAVWVRRTGRTIPTQNDRGLPNDVVADEEGQQPVAMLDGGFIESCKGLNSLSTADEATTDVGLNKA